MKITFKTGGMMGELLPAGAKDDQAVIDMPEGAAVTDVMAYFDLPLDEFYLVILNDVVVPKTTRPETILHEGDELGIFPPLKGG